MRVYNEPLGDVVCDEHGRPRSWTWRGRAYTSAGRHLEFWVTLPEWWNEPDPDPDADAEIRHWRLEAFSAQGHGVVEIEHDLATGAFVLTGVED